MFQNERIIKKIDKSLFKLTGYQVKMKIFLSISEIVKLKVKLVNYFLVCGTLRKTEDVKIWIQKNYLKQHLSP
jgi:hypothetical protein